MHASSSMRCRCMRIAHVMSVAAATAFAAAALANHGPGTSGGGSSTISGETLDRGKFDLTFRMDYTEFEHVSEAEIEARVGQGGEHFDALRRSFLNTVSLAYGITDDFQVGASIGYYYGQDFISGHTHEHEEEPGGEHEEVNIGHADPNGITDLWLNAKYRILEGGPGNLSVLGGIKLPTGRDDVKLDNDHTIEPSSQPGSGSVDYQAGLACSRFLTNRITIDASGAYTFRTEHGDFKVGDRADIGLALAYRLTEDIRSTPTFTVFGEILGVWLDKDEEAGVENDNSGGTFIYLSPGFRVRFNENLYLTAAPAFPVVQDLNGEQVETRFKLGISLSFVF
jgi:hypothetical protein